MPLPHFHKPVLVNEVLTLLDQKPGAHIIDGTLGDGGHTEALLESLGGKAKILGIDLDPIALETAKARLNKFGDAVIFASGNFREMKDIAATKKFSNVTGILLDLGIRSAEIDESGLGFTFQKDEPLIMRFDARTDDVTAASIVNSYSKDELVRLLRDYGEETFAGRIADSIIATRRKERILRTSQLVSAIMDAMPGKMRHGKTHPATKTFQALRIAVNEELLSLEHVLPAAIQLLEEGGVLCVISFHSLEDRMVKNVFRKSMQLGIGTSVIKKPMVPSDEEVSQNPRARSAKVRAFKKARSV